MRVNSPKQWYEYEADNNNIKSLLVVEDYKKPGRYVIDFKLYDKNSILKNSTLESYTYQKFPKSLTMKSVMMIINTVTAVQTNPISVYFYTLPKDYPNEQTTNEPPAIEP
nr:MAG: hypothetical protein [Microvirus sp.]